MSHGLRVIPTRSIVALLLGAALVFLALLVRQVDDGQAASQAPTFPSNPDFISAEVEPGEPCPGAVESSADEVSQLEGKPVWLPDSESVPPLVGVWMCTGTPTFDYSGVTFAYESGWRVEDPAKRWQAMAEQWGRGTVETVLERPAFVLPVTELDPRGEVLILVDGTLIRILGDGKTSIEDLKAAANTIRLD